MLSNSRTEECSSPYAQVIFISTVGSSVDRDEPGVCLYGIHPWIFQFFPSQKIQGLGSDLSSCLAELFPVLWGTPGICLRVPKFPSLMPSSSSLEEPQLQGCSLAASPGQVLTLVWNIGSKSCFF